MQRVALRSRSLLGVGLLSKHSFEASLSVAEELGVDALERLVLLSHNFRDAASMGLLVLVVSRMVLTLRHLDSITRILCYLLMIK